MFPPPGDTMSACQVTSDISYMRINVWKANTTCQLLPNLLGYNVLKFTNLKHN